MLEQIFTNRKKLIWRKHVEVNSAYSIGECISRLKTSNSKKIGSLKLSVEIEATNFTNNQPVAFTVTNAYGNAKAYAIGTISAAPQGTFVQFDVGIAQVDLLIYIAGLLFVAVAAYKSASFSIAYLIGIAIVLVLISLVIWFAYGYVKSELEIAVTKLLSA